MSRKRIIDTENFYFDTELYNLLGERGLHLYIRLWGLAEDWGGYEARYDDIALRMGALKFDNKEVENYISKLIGIRKIISYVKDGKTMHWMVNFMKHQKLDNPAMPHLPLPEWIKCELKEYPSKKKYAFYTVITDKLPVGYQNTTRTVETETKQKQKQKRNYIDPAGSNTADLQPDNAKNGAKPPNIEPGDVKTTKPVQVPVKPKELTMVQKITLYYKKLKGFDLEDKEWDSLNFPRCAKSSKLLDTYFKSNFKIIKLCMQDITEKLNDKGLDWTLETIVKHASDWKLKNERLVKNETE